MRIRAPQDLRVTTLNGAMVFFQAGVEKEVGNEVGSIALSMGAQQVGDDVPPVAVAVETEDMNPLDEVVAAIEQLVSEGAVEDFKANGEPKAASINRVCGKTIPPELREEAWDQVFNG
ncbi:MAG: hypothetical protein CMO44_12645 [Verrucomicrobiales bacterium]|nr:hypothetical protein [Verrucomicrobiales bacterium]